MFYNLVNYDQRAICRAYFGHIGATEILDLFKQIIHCDTFKQTCVADPSMLKVFNSIFLSALLKSNV